MAARSRTAARKGQEGRAARKGEARGRQPFGRAVSQNLMPAVGIIACCAVGICVAGTLFDAREDLSSASPVPAPPVSLERVFLEQEPRDDSGRLPAAFAEEVFSLEAFYDVRVSPGGSVVGLLSYKALEEVFRLCEAELVGHGWTKVESGQAASASFVKSQGEYTWLLVSCIEVSGTTSVIVSYA